MLAPFTLDVYRDDLACIVQSVFSTMMDLDVAVSTAPWTHSPDTITSAVHFVGVWRGATLVECGAPQAFQFAARFMGIEMPVAIDDDVRDVMGELANMVAGNLKSLLPHGVDLSMPSVVVGSDYSVHVCGASAVERMIFSSATGNFRITLIEMLTPA
ncbi:MAG TPA: chemotaxis protein CheX [Bryobacteraceae bacterium]|jgi:chemotaxis protein CheX|nr:chemotaxis protein CheX [Bryobacteraceae bacterium]